MKIVLFVLLLMSAPVLADPFNIYLPFNTQYAPESLGKFEKAFIVGYEEGGDNFQLQVVPVTGVDQFVDTEADNDPVLGFMIGLGLGFELEFDTRGNANYTSVKYSFKNPKSTLHHSFVLGDITSQDWGHGGLLLQEDDCGLLDFSCLFSDIFNLFNVFGSSNDKYEYDYEADIKGLMLAYLQGYQYSASVMPYWGVYYIDYDIGYTVTDNTGGSGNQSGHIDTDLMFVTLGARINAGKPDSKGEQSVWLVNYVIYKDSMSHGGDFNGELRFSYINRY